MIINPIIPIGVMVIICIGLLFMKRKGWMGYIRQILIILLLFIINLRVMVKDVEIPTVLPKVDVMFVIDNSISMVAEDYGFAKERRLDAVKRDCKYIMEQLPGASFSIVKFDDKVDVLVPYTTDTNMAMQTLDLLKGEPKLHAGGTSLNAMMEEMESLLNDGRENCKIVFFISDGEITTGDNLKSYSRLRLFTDGGAVLGYGTRTGGGMRPVLSYGDDEEEAEYIEIYESLLDSEKAISKIDEKNLRSIASDLGVDYVHMTSQSEVDKILKSIENDVFKNAETELENDTAGYADTYYWLLIPLAVLLVFDVIAYKRKV